MRQRMTWLWNGEPDSKTRRDVIIWRTGETWSVEDCQGGEDGWSRTITAISDTDAAAIANELTASHALWQVLSGARMAAAN
jgi:hypothetical protein